MLPLPPISAGGGGPSSNKSDPFFGSLLGNFDTSNWSVNFGDSGDATVKAGDKTGPSLTPSNISGIPQNTPGLQLTGGGISTTTMLMVAGFGGALLLVLLWKR